MMYRTKMSDVNASGTGESCTRNTACLLPQTLFVATNFARLSGAPPRSSLGTRFASCPEHASGKRLQLSCPWGLPQLSSAALPWLTPFLAAHRQPLMDKAVASLAISVQLGELPFGPRAGRRAG